MHLFIKEPKLVSCPKCQKPVLPHIACKNCGFYKGKEVIDVMKKLSKKERKTKEKEMAAQEAKKAVENKKETK
jgi:large subunit ribosomal protein L32